jgi:uncharacterized RDD family membrane protein YckC
MAYAGFLKRFLALTIDAFIIIPLSFLPMALFLVSVHRVTAITAILLAVTLGIAYNVVCLALWGKTLGKKVANIKVVRVDGTDISWREAFMRSLVDLIIALISVGGHATAILTVSDELYLAALNAEMLSPEYMNYMQELERINLVPAWFGYLSLAWAISELVTIFFNQKKRALHDFIAGTVVIKTA